MEAVCPKHGLVKFYTRGKRGGGRCSRCWLERMEAMRGQLKQELVELLGGKCSRCGYDRSHWAMHFHHVDPATKTERLAYLISKKARLKALEEVTKCVLLCANCHAEVEHGIFTEGKGLEPLTPEGATA